MIQQICSVFNRRKLGYKLLKDLKQNCNPIEINGKVLILLSRDRILPLRTLVLGAECKLPERLRDTGFDQCQHQQSDARGMSP